MKIQWLGHSCFLITAGDGTRILTDPFDEKVGYPLPAVEADIVTVSHQHYDHNNTGVVKGAFEVFDKPGEHTANKVVITGFPTFHDEEHGAKRGSNIVFRLLVDGLTVVHCGDLGHPIGDELAHQIGHVDVLLVPVGGFYTIDSQQALGVVWKLKPALTIPMHFKTPAMGFPIETVEPFLKAAGGGSMAHAREVEVDSASLRDLAGVLVLDPPG